MECIHSGHILVLSLISRGDFIIAGDVLKSVSLLLYKPSDNMIEEIARDYDSKNLTAIELFNEDTLIGSDTCFNIFTLQRNNEAATDEERSKLEIVGQFHLGEFVNRFRHGSLVMKVADGEGYNFPTILYGTISGSLGVIASIPRDLFELLFKVQVKLTSVIKGVGSLTHSS